VGKRARLRAQRAATAAQAAAAPTDWRARQEAQEGRSQAWRDAYAESAALAKARRERDRGPWAKRGSRLVRCSVEDETWNALCALAAAEELPASQYLGRLAERHVAAKERGGSVGQSQAGAQGQAAS
jgi:hypothetical protein